MAATIYALRLCKGPEVAPALEKEMRAAAAGAGYAVEGLATDMWRERKGTTAEAHEFIDMLGREPESMVPAHRIALLALLAHRWRIQYADQAEEFLSNAGKALGIDNEYERWVLNFELTVEEDDSPGARHAKFLFGTAQRMVEATLDRSLGREQTAQVETMWALFFGVGIEAQLDELDNARLAHVVE